MLGALCVGQPLEKILVVVVVVVVDVAAGRTAVVLEVVELAVLVQSAQVPFQSLQFAEGYDPLYAGGVG